MIWFFLAGMVAGAGCVILFIHNWVRSHAKIVRSPMDDNEEEESRE